MLPKAASSFRSTRNSRSCRSTSAIGQRFTLKVVAVDGDNLTGPHVSSGTPYNFQVVSDDELLALVAVKELNIRRRFEQILDEVKNTRKDLLLHRTRLDEAKALRAAPVSAGREAEVREQLNAIDIAVITRSSGRSTGSAKMPTKPSRSNRNSAISATNSKTMPYPTSSPCLERIDGGIIKPLHSINTLDYNNVDDSLVLLRKVLEEKADPFARFDETVDQVSRDDRTSGSRSGPDAETRNGERSAADAAGHHQVAGRIAGKDPSGTQEEAH